MAIDLQERSADPAYQRAASLVLGPAPTPTIDGRPWVGAVAARQQQLHAERARSRARNTVRGWSAPLRRALEWMETQWGLQGTGHPFSAAEAAAHGGVLVTSYLRHLEDTTASANVYAAVSAASTAINQWLQARNQAAVGNNPTASAQRDRLRREHSHQPRQTPGLGIRAVCRVSCAWGFDSAYAYQQFTALALMLGTAVLGRFDTLSWVTLGGVCFQYVDGLRLVSICLTKAKNRQTGLPLWIDIPAVPGEDYCLYMLIVHVLRQQYAVRVPQRRRFFSTASSGRGLGLLFPCWGASALGNHRHRFNPVMDWSRRAQTAMYRRQLVNAVCEILRVPRTFAQQFGMSSLRSSGDTHLRRHHVDQWEHCEFGRWATAAVEERYDRRAAVEHARSLLDRGIAF